MTEKLQQECWSLDTSLAVHILPRLLYFKNWCDRYGLPSELESDEWEEILDEMIWAFTYISQDYPKLTDLIIEDIITDRGDSTETGFISMNIELVYKNGYTEEDYIRLLEKDISNMCRCQAGTFLFGKYFSALWN